MYTTKNFKTKKALKEAVKNGEQVTYYRHGPLFREAPKDGIIYCEGPHYPAPHKWYAICMAKDGVIVKVK